MSDFNQELVNELAEDSANECALSGTGNLFTDIAVVTAGVVAGNILFWGGSKILGALGKGIKKGFSAAKEKAAEKKQSQKETKDEQPEPEVVNPDGQSAT